MCHRGDSRAALEGKLRAKAQRAAEAAERRAEFLTDLTAHQPQKLLMNCFHFYLTTTISGALHTPRGAPQKES